MNFDSRAARGDSGSSAPMRRQQRSRESPRQTSRLTQENPRENRPEASCSRNSCCRLHLPTSPREYKLHALAASSTSILTRRLKTRGPIIYSDHAYRLSMPPPLAAPAPPIRSIYDPRVSVRPSPGVAIMLARYFNWWLRVKSCYAGRVCCIIMRL